MSILIFLIISYILLSISLYLLFPKANVEAWKGLVPGLNFVEWCKIIGRKPAYALWLLFPIVNIFIFCGMAVDMVRSFGKYLFKHSAAAVIYAPAIFAWLATKKEEKYDGPTLLKEAEYKLKLDEAIKNNKVRQYKKLMANNPYKKTAVREWTEAIVFAVFAAAFIRMFLIEAYKIPTPSMEGSLLVGDFLFVSKAHYGIRTPMTPIMIPLLHNRIPFLNKESYQEKPSLPYRRLPALEKIDRNEPIVFNWPVGDSVYLSPIRSYTAGQVNRHPELKRELRNAQLITRPIDKKDHYIKRCIALPGDSLQIIDREVYINGQKQEKPSKTQFAYFITTDVPISPKKLDEIGVAIDDHPYGEPNAYFLTDEQVEKIKTYGNNVNVNVLPHTQPHIGVFPHDPQNFGTWSVDNFGPIWIPKKGETIELNKETIALYKRAIDVYENNDFNINGDQFIVNGQPATTYTFKQDYYWAMGDNRHNSEDSRAWGYVPHDHIVGKPLFIWFSTKSNSQGGGIRWNRLFTGATKK